MLEFRNLMPFVLFFFPIKIAKAKPREILYCVTKTAKESTREIRDFKIQRRDGNEHVA